MAGSLLGRATNYNGMVRHNITRVMTSWQHAGGSSPVSGPCWTRSVAALVQPVPCRGANTTPVVGSGDRTGAGRREPGAHLAGRSAARHTAWGAGSAGPVPDGPGAPALAAAGTRHQPGRVHVGVRSGERFCQTLYHRAGAAGCPRRPMMGMPAIPASAAEQAPRQDGAMWLQGR
jgi:hypothetical protein